MPSVKKGEPKNKFISRCVPVVMKEGTAKDNKQAVAICSSMYDQHKKKHKSRGSEIMAELLDNLNKKE
jgi:hypothetical protein